jgi:hypothetical protein
MTRGLLHQQPGLGFSIPRSAASPQHGQKTNPQPKGAEPAREPRSAVPRPGGQHQQ